MGTSESYLAVQLLEPLAIVNRLSIIDAGPDGDYLSLYMSPYADILTAWGDATNGNLIDFLLSDENTKQCTFVRSDKDDRL